MRTGDLIRQFGVSGETIRRWVGEFSVYLSEGAQKHSSRQSSFNSEDFIILATIHSLSKEGLSYDAIHKRLQAGYRIEDITSATVGYDDGRMVPAAAVEQIISATEVRTELAQVMAEKKQLEVVVSQMRQQLDSLRKEYEERIDSVQSAHRREVTELSSTFRSEVQNLQDQIAQLQRELGRAEGRLEVYREQNDKEG